jgi:cobalt/nickel transport system permease protein
MHIPDGLLPPTVSIAGYGITGGVTWFCLRQINKNFDPSQQIPKASLLTAAFFLASLIHIPVPPFSIHLVLNGLMGVILGYLAFPAILVGLFFQAVFFQHGGLTTLGVNAVIMGIPSLLAYQIWLLHKLRWFKQPFGNNIFAFFAGSLGLFVSALIFVLITLNTISTDLDVNAEKTAIIASLSGYMIQGIIEGVLTVMLVSFFTRVKPEILESFSNN